MCRNSYTHIYIYVEQRFDNMTTLTRQYSNGDKVITWTPLHEKYKKDFPKGDPLIVACEKGNIEDVQKMVTSEKYNISFNINKEGKTSRNITFTPLGAAARYERLNVVRFLLENNADTSIRTKREGWNVLHIAAYYSKKTPDVVHYLMKNLPLEIINQKDNDGETPLDNAHASPYPIKDAIIKEISENGGGHGVVKKYYPNGDVYIGEWENNKINGKGKYTYSNGNFYEGQFKNDLRHGKGKMTVNGKVYEGEWENDKNFLIDLKVKYGAQIQKQTYGSVKDVYEGQMRGNVRHGKGKYIWKGGTHDGDFYIGDWKDGKMTGKGTRKYSKHGDIYTGDFVSGQRHGKGKYVWKGGKEDGDIYVGDWIKGKMTGKGRKFYAQYGDVYDGNFIDGRRVGNGKYTWGKTGGTYEGPWKDGKMHGHGKRVFGDNGDIYIGDFVMSNREGKGRYTYANGTVYEGEYKQNKADGHGKYTYKTGGTYEGELKDGFRQGFGVYHYKSGAIYVGEWQNGKEHGKGKKVYENKDVYQGDYVDGHMDGEGTYTWYPDGANYTGGWKNGKREGHGTYIDKDGGIYVGEYKNSQMHGPGVFTSKNGKYREEVWENGKVKSNSKWKKKSDDDVSKSASSSSSSTILRAPALILRRQLSEEGKKLVLKSLNSEELDLGPSSGTML